MKRTPAPPSTAWAAASIWSGVGEVKTWPGQAASSMPTPTKPACIGSWPEPPPEISATLPARVGAARVTKVGSRWTPDEVGMGRAEAAQRLRQDVVDPVDQLLHDVRLLFLVPAVGRLGVPGQPDGAGREVQDQRLDLAGGGLGAEPGSAIRSSRGRRPVAARRRRSG